MKKGWFAVALVLLWTVGAVAAEIKVGDKVAEFQLKDPTGKEYSLDSPEFKGKVAMVDDPLGNLLIWGTVVTGKPMGTLLTREEGLNEFGGEEVQVDNAANVPVAHADALRDFGERCRFPGRELFEPGPPAGNGAN